VTPGLLADLLARRDTLRPWDRQALNSWLDVLTKEQAGTVIREWYRRDVDSLEASLKKAVPDPGQRNVLLDYLRRTFTP
jgi:hypothetical protein